MIPGNKLQIESLDNDWHDKDEVLLHACFQLLKDCIEKEDLFNDGRDWSYDAKAKKELKTLYAWWKRRAQMEETFDKDDKQYQEDDLMLQRLIKIRWKLWT